MGIMDSSFFGIDSIGFDLDGTLYSPNSKIDNEIGKKIAKAIIAKRPDFGTEEEVISYYQKRRNEIGSGAKVFEELGFEKAHLILDYCLSDPKIWDFLEPDKKLIELLFKIKEKYNLFLISTSEKDLAFLKFQKIGILKEIFSYMVFGDDLSGIKKSSGEMHKYFLKCSEKNPSSCCYIGDSLIADIMPAKALGMKTILVGNKCKEADFSVEKIYDIESILL